MEKKFSGKHVVFIAQRRILKKPTRKANFLKQKRPMSRTLTMVHNAILDDLVFPAEIVGKRIRTRLDGSRLYKENLIYLLFPCNFMFSSNSWTFKFVYINRKNLIKTDSFAYSLKCGGNLGQKAHFCLQMPGFYETISVINYQEYTLFSWYQLTPRLLLKLVDSQDWSLITFVLG